MRKLFLMLCVVCLTAVGLMAQNKVTVPRGQALSNQSAAFTAIFQQMSILGGVTEMKGFELRKYNGQAYVQATGVNAAGNTVLFRAKVSTSKVGQDMVYDFGSVLVGDSCTSNNCTGCTFSGAGCNCPTADGRAASSCDYTATK